jgi:hypothetical protein
MLRFLLVFLFPVSLLAWGGRGHDAICVASSFLVKDKVLKEFLQSRSHVMGHLCNIPDTYWRSLPGDVNKVGSPAHFMDPEVLGLKINEVPLNFAELVRDYTGKENKMKEGAKIFSVPEELGSLWWRVDEFYRRISGLNFKDSPPPDDKKLFQDDNYAFNSKVYEMWVYMGLMGHFVGDAGQPFHNTADYDGYGKGHGGIHGYYETDIVSLFGPELPEQIRQRAQKLKNVSFLKAPTPLEKMKELSIVSAKDIEKILKLDPVIKKSEAKSEKGMTLKTMAERKPAEVGHKLFASGILDEMARSSALLAQLWDEAYAAAGKPDLSKYRSYKYPFTPDFVRPDYVPAEKTENKQK